MIGDRASRGRRSTRGDAHVDPYGDTYADPYGSTYAEPYVDGWADDLPYDRDRDLHPPYGVPEPIGLRGTPWWSGGGHHADGNAGHDEVSDTSSEERGERDRTLSIPVCDPDLADPDLVMALQREVAEELAREGEGLGRGDKEELCRHLIATVLQRYATDRVGAGVAPMGPEEEQVIGEAIWARMFGMAGLQALIDDPAVENININGFDQVWAKRSDGSKVRAPAVAGSDAEIVELVRIAGRHLGMAERRFDAASPELDLRLPSGHRLSAVMEVTERPVISVRRHRLVDVTLEDLVALGTLDGPLSSFLAAAVRARKNIVVAGPMNAGKTTLLRALASEVPARERIVTIEQSLELALDRLPERHPDVVAMEAREPNSEGEGEITMARLLRRALRMDADRVIVGEVLGDEILNMLNAMSQGRSGSMCTIHADSSAGVFRRMASYAVQAAERLPLEATNLLIAGAVHFVVYVSLIDDALVSGFEEEQGDVRQREAWTADRGHAVRQGTLRRVVTSVREVVDAEGPMVVSNEIWRPAGGGIAVPGVPLRTETYEELLAHGLDRSPDGPVRPALAASGLLEAPAGRRRGIR